MSVDFLSHIEIMHAMYPGALDWAMEEASWM